jgi:hypothetical protein
MNALSQITASIPLPHFDATCARLNQWRGQMVENFARCEQAATETLALLNSTKLEVKGVKFPHLVGQRYARLEALLSAADAPSGHTRFALAAIGRFREHDSLRTMLCHGVTKIAVDRAGDWVALITLLSFKGGVTTSDRLTLLEVEGRTLLAQLIEARKKVCTALGQVRREATDPA